MPFISQKFGTFKSFAVASIEDIYSKDKLDSADRYAVTEFQSGVFFNEDGVFRFQALPRAAQLAPVFGICAGDATGDGHPDLILSGNFIRGPQIETGAFDGGVGLLLEGNGTGEFAPHPASVSGLVLEGDHRALVRTDLDGDGRPDLIAAANNGPLRALKCTPGDDASWLRVRLPQDRAAGAEVTLRREGHVDQLVVLAAGGGYWSQEDSVAWFGLGSGKAAKGQLLVRWPDGTSTTTDWDGKNLAPTLDYK